MAALCAQSGGASASTQTVLVFVSPGGFFRSKEPYQVWWKVERFQIRTIRATPP